DVVDAIVKADEVRMVTPLTQQLEKRTAERAAWTEFQKLVLNLNESSRALRVSGFGGFLATSPKSPTSGQTLFGATASNLAEPGRYRVEVVQLAETAKLGGKAVA